jgi:hypothetical protein
MSDLTTLHHKKGRPTFGQTIRGARLGFHWYPPVNAMVRIEDAGDTAFTVILCPSDRLPSTVAGTPHRVWWESNEDVLAMVTPPLAGRTVTQMQRLLVDNSGRVI